MDCLNQRVQQRGLIYERQGCREQRKVYLSCNKNKSVLREWHIDKIMVDDDMLSDDLATQYSLEVPKS